MHSNTSRLYQDVIRLFESYLRAQNIIDGGLQSKRSLNAIQGFFNEMQQQAGLPMQQLSQVISYSCGDNTVGVSG